MTRNKKIAITAILLGCILWLHGSLVGLSDDEAYYWVLSQKPALGYAFHPPAVAWCIALSERLLGTFLGWIPVFSRESFVRFPAALMSALIFYFALKWLNKIGVQSLRRAAMVLFSFVGYFALSWMIVPDLPLFLGWMLLFTATWDVISEESPRLPFCRLILGTALILLSKYSGILAIFSAALSILFWAPPRKKFPSVVAVFVGLVLAAIPICLWNAEHQWASILYQIRDRHGHLEFSGLRYLRFWIVQLILAGPIALPLFVMLFFCRPFSRSFAQHRQYILLWALLPTLLFAIQPAFSDFKIHWIFVAWWPLFLGLAILASQDRYWKWLRIQCTYGCFLFAIGLFSCHFPLISWVAQHFNPTVNPLWDVTNDLYGWRDLRTSWASNNFPDNIVIGGRYQTASQAAFYLHGLAKVTLLPRDLKEQDEWPTANVTETEGPAPSKLKAPITFVADLRYQDPPSFPGAHCQPLRQLHTNRFNFLAKTITVWNCFP